jgi:hypothetical protein
MFACFLACFLAGLLLQVQVMQKSVASLYLHASHKVDAAKQAINAAMEASACPVGCASPSLAQPHLMAQLIIAHCCITEADHREYAIRAM